MTEGQTISELSLGFWRFLVARRLTGLWPDLASAFPHAPDRKRKTVEAPLGRLHDFRNRLAHHQRIWNRDPAACYGDLLLVAGYLESEFPTWIHRRSPSSCSRDISAQAIMDRLGHEPATLAEFEAAFGAVMSSGTEG